MERGWSGPIAAAAQALRAGDPLVALQHVALRGDPAALALRGIAVAQLGDLERARRLLRRAARRFRPGERLARARCLVAEAEVALASRELGGWPGGMGDALRTFAVHGDRENAIHARLLQLRRLLLLGRVGEAAAGVTALALGAVPARLEAVAALVSFEVSVRRGAAGQARHALSRARGAAARSGIGALRAEVERAGRILDLPAARLVGAGAPRPLTLSEVEEVLASADLVVDGCRRVVRQGTWGVSLARRPALFALLCGLAEAWPDAAPRAALVERAFASRRVNASHRVRLRVGIGRLRRALRPHAGIRATPGGFRLEAHGGGGVRLVAPPVDSPAAAVLALVADGEAWSTSALSLALGASRRTVQRALAALLQAGQVRALGRGRSRRWLSAPLAGFATALLLPDLEGAS